MIISIKLIKKEVSADKVIRSDKLIHAENIEGIGTFYYKISRSKPEWVDKFFIGTLRCAEKLKTSAASGVLLGSVIMIVQTDSLLLPRMS